MDTLVKLKTQLFGPHEKDVLWNIKYKQNITSNSNNKAFTNKQTLTTALFVKDVLQDVNKNTLDVQKLNKYHYD